MRAGVVRAGRTGAFAVVLFLFSFPASAQAPSADWRTLSTPHFRVHYTAPAEEWTRNAAARLEAIRERVAEEVGYAPSEVVGVVVAEVAHRPTGHVPASPAIQDRRLCDSAYTQ